jgi:hypothetical protein
LITGSAGSVGGGSMAKVKYAANMGANHEFEIGANYSPDPALALADGHTKTSATLVSATNQFSIDFFGTGFTYAGDELTGGIATKIVFRDDDGDKLATISDFNRNVPVLMTELEADVSAMLSELQDRADRMIGSSSGEYLIGEAGNDKIAGKGGNDAVCGNSGDDLMSGGSGNDRFEFYGGQSGDDVITDFEIGDAVNFDTIFIAGMDYEIVKSGKEAMFAFSDGSTLLLEGVRFADRAGIQIDDGT